MSVQVRSSASPSQTPLFSFHGSTSHSSSSYSSTTQSNLLHNDKPDNQSSKDPDGIMEKPVHNGQENGKSFME